ncbi:hypothetical protein AVEN_212991-1 [Araneus ventricosus]|uniref:Uncharacterized protein n=1 Tax=Araneus ventricosus TaxID=182803 RepID=A0A4Y2TNW2_ARAVE|nr:hypothetical protein AVEN_43850-1 [Araneus ventricosus]GBO02396.1 hypothetical protein AVEN_212991-1 [Araneus ventricosus]
MMPLLLAKKVLLPPLHIKLGLMKQFVKALPKQGEGFKCLCDQFPGLSEAKLKEEDGEKRCRYYSFEWESASIRILGIKPLSGVTSLLDLLALGPDLDAVTHVAQEGCPKRFHTYHMFIPQKICLECKSGGNCIVGHCVISRPGKPDTLTKV